MKFLQSATLLITLSISLACCMGEPSTEGDPAPPPLGGEKDSIGPDTVYTVAPTRPASFAIDTKDQSPDNIVNFAKTLIGVPYRYGSTDPTQGFDCSGFITFVFNHFGISVPRSSIDFTDVGTEVNVSNAAPGDLILFTGTDSTERFVGHMGIITENTDSVRFIHSTSGKKYGVTITTLNPYYKKRFVKVTRVFTDAR